MPYLSKSVRVTEQCGVRSGAGTCGDGPPVMAVGVSAMEKPC